MVMADRLSDCVVAGTSSGVSRAVTGPGLQQPGVGRTSTISVGSVSRPSIDGGLVNNVSAGLGVISLTSGGVFPA